MPDWKRVRINFPTVKLGQFIEPIKETIAEKGSEDFKTVYGVTNVEGITITGKKASKDISNYIVIDKNYFAYNPYRINVGSIGFNTYGLKGCVSPAYVVFRTKDNLSPGFLYVYLKSEFGNHLINWYGNRGGVRNALRYDDLCEIDIPDINYKAQIELLNKIDRSKISLNSFSEEITQQLEYLKQLRQRILQEAVEGKLTAKWRVQHPDLINGDNHASKLLEKIKAEKERLTKNTKGAKNAKALPPISEEEKPFDLPEGWVWCRLGNSGVVNPRNYIDDDLEVSFSPMALISEKYGIWPMCETKRWGDVKKGFTHFAENDVAIAKITPCFENSKACVFEGLINGYGAGTTELHVLRPIIVNPKYIYIFVKTSSFLADGEKKMTGVCGQKRVPVDYFSNALFPLAPLAEQQAIVERVDKLMSMIDELEKQVSERKEQSEMLMQSVLREAFIKERF
ncbi:MAG: hypothetical protein CV087_12655 [Candidatus Brocadia sp. WS118]|nr:MAG: hypothetical protein CV087_12655 [Candidatus Brocadia sp. WS118]